MLISKTINLTKSLKNYWNKIKDFFLIVLLFVLLLPLPNQVFSEELEKSNQLIEEMIIKSKKHAIETLELNKEQRSEKITPLIRQYVNLDFMARATTGSFWSKANDEQQLRYKDALLHQIVNTVEEHLNTLATLTYTPLNSEFRGKKIIYIRGKIEDKSKNNPPINLLWKLAKSQNETMSIIDLEIEGISLVTSHKSEVMSILRKNKGDFDYLIERLNIKK